MDNHLIDIFSEVEDYHWWFEGRRLLLTKVINSYKKNFGKNNSKDSQIKILDVGCGSGGNLKFLSKFGEIFGIDNLKQAVDHCKKRGFTQVKVADGNKLPFKDNSFDVITYLDVLEHFPDDTKTIHEAKRVLKEDGIIVITVPAMPLIWSKHDEMQGHVKRYTKKDIDFLATSQKINILYLTFFNIFLSPPIIIIRILSRTKLFDKFSSYDSKLNFDIAKIKVLNNIFLSIFKLEVLLGKWFKFPFGVSLLVVFKK